MSSPTLPPLPPLIVVAGATATGKTALSLELAEALAAAGNPAEIISADSRQVYRGMDIGTAKVTPEEQARVHHHGLDLVDPDEPFRRALRSAAPSRYSQAEPASISGRSHAASLWMSFPGIPPFARISTHGLSPTVCRLWSPSFSL